MLYSEVTDATTLLEAALAKAGLKPFTKLSPRTLALEVSITIRFLLLLLRVLKAVKGSGSSPGASVVVLNGAGVNNGPPLLEARANDIPESRDGFLKRLNPLLVGGRFRRRIFLTDKKTQICINAKLKSLVHVISVSDVTMCVCLCVCF
jgi:hypothetical protein